jgi:hypothetical protein
MPYAPNAERHVQPNAGKIAAAAIELVGRKEEMQRP